MGSDSGPNRIPLAASWKRLLQADKGREPSEEATAVVTVGDGSWTRVVAVGVGIDFASGTRCIRRWAALGGREKRS